MHPLVAEPTCEQANLLDLIYRGRLLAGTATQWRWPIFQYVEQELYRLHDVDAMHTLTECPAIGGPGFGGGYGWTWSATRQPGDEIGLTIAGMAHVPEASHEVELFLATLGVLVTAQRAFKSSPTEVQAVSVTSSELREALAPSRRLDGVALERVRDTLRHEPATWHCRDSQHADEWALTLSPFLRPYAGLETSGEYLDRIVEVLAPPTPTTVPLYPSPLSLPEAIDYLNAVWRVHAGRPLLRIARAEAAAKLALDCASADEFESRVSALCSILDALEVPGREGHKLGDLNDYLEKELSEEARGRAREAVDDLRAFFAVRKWRQHAGTEHETRRGIDRLGLTLPIVDWSTAWQQLQVRAVEALSALREEVETLAP